MYIFCDGVPDSNHVGIYYVNTFVIVSVGEILLGKTAEKLCGIYYWDYTALPFHITRYTSVFTSIGFSLIITGFMKKLFIPIMDILHGEMDLKRSIVVCIIMSFLIADFIYSFGYMIKYKNFYYKWKKEIKLFQNSKISRKAITKEGYVTIAVCLTVMGMLLLISVPSNSMTRITLLPIRRWAVSPTSV